MKPAVQKTAQVTALMLILSILLPVIAFGATGFKNLKYYNGQVTGTVYSNVYDKAVSPTVYLFTNGYRTDQTGKFTVHNKVYGYYEYDFTFNNVSRSTYEFKLFGPLGQGFDVTDAVYASVHNASYNSSSDNNSGSGGGYGGGGGSASASESIQVNLNGDVDATQLKDSFDKYDTITLTLAGDFANIPAKALDAYTSKANKVLKVTNDNGTYIIPLNVLKLSDLATATSTTIDDLKLKVTIAKASQSISDSVYNAAKALGANVTVAPVDFDIVAVGKDSKTVAVDLGSNYLSRVLKLNKSVDRSKATGVWFNTKTNQLTFVPTVFSDTEAVIKRNGNSVYTVVELNKSFSDIKGHWAEGYISLLANKLVVDGVSATSFEPDRSITRAEFAALVVRSLGIDTSVGSNSFKDVSSSDWYAGVVGAAVYSKLIDGYEDGTFRPNATINREELAALVVRALAYAKAKPDVSAAKQNELLAKFNDANAIVWAKNELATAIDAKLVDGLTDSTLGPRQTATRAQSATILARFLKQANFINN